MIVANLHGPGSRENVARAILLAAGAAASAPALLTCCETSRHVCLGREVGRYVGKTEPMCVHSLLQAANPMPLRIPLVDQMIR
jgi:hypothetical protein